MGSSSTRTSAAVVDRTDAVLPWQVTTYGTVNAGVCERYLPGFKSPNAADLIASSPFPDSD